MNRKGKEGAWADKLQSRGSEVRGVSGKRDLTSFESLHFWGWRWAAGEGPGNRDLPGSQGRQKGFK